MISKCLLCTHARVLYFKMNINVINFSIIRVFDF